MSKRKLRTFTTLLFASGALLAVWPLVQNGFAWWNQKTLREQWNASASAASARTTSAQAATPPASSSKARPAAQVAAPIRAWPPTRLVIPAIGVDEVVVQGTDDASLRRGPGHYPTTALPGQSNCVIAGHRNVYGSPFARVNELPLGALIELHTPREIFRYRALATYGVNETDLSVLAPLASGVAPRLTLVTCTVPHSWQRIVLVAEREQPGAQY